MLKHTACPKCGAPFVASLQSALIEACGYCGSAFKNTQPAETPLVCGCGRGGVNRCALCTIAICPECSNCIEHFDLAQILLRHRIPPKHHTSMVHRLKQIVPLNATLCVPCLDSTLGRWLSTNPTTL